MSTFDALSDMTAMDIAARLPRAVAAASGAGCDALLVTNLTNIRYLTGFTGSAALLLLTGDRVVFVTDGRYREQSASELSDAGVDAELEVPDTAEEQWRLLSEVVPAGSKVGLEADHVSWARQRKLAGNWFSSATLVPTEGLVERLRLRKDAGEVARIRAAAAIADEAFSRVRHRIGESVTEAELALELDSEMRHLGAQDVSFETIVASGPNGSRPHHTPGQRRISGGDLVVMDFGALVDGYHSDMTRTLQVGDVTDTQAQMWDIVSAAQAAGVDAVAAGVEAAEVDRVCRDVIGESGWGDAFVHSTGHGVGLDIHEEPRLGSTSEAVLETGWIVTVEPGVYLPEHGGVRIEDTVVVTDGGCQSLTLAPKNPAVDVAGSQPH